VLAPASVQENADLAYQAFDLAEKYRNPVIIGSDAAIGQMVEPVELPPMKEHDIDTYDWAVRARKKGEAQRGITNVYYIIGAEAYTTYLRDKVARMERDEQRWESVQTEDADIILVAYGISSRVSKEAVKLARAKGVKLGLIRPITLWPFPKKAFDAVGGRVKGFLCVEMSILGQMVDDVILATGNKRPVESYGEFANVPSAEIILDRVDEMLKKY
jgi:2-oxoglutarate ferredoxin oxidoreductase subunit alpha